MMVSGASNGAMFVYYLLDKKPDLFKGWLLEYGQPVVGYLNKNGPNKSSYIMSLHGR